MYVAAVNLKLLLLPRASIAGLPAIPWTRWWFAAPIPSVRSLS